MTHVKAHFRLSVQDRRVWNLCVPESNIFVQEPICDVKVPDLGIDKKKTRWSFYCLKNEAKNFSGSHPTKTQKAAAPSEESMRNHLAWIVKCKFKDFRTTWKYVFNMLLIYCLYSSYQLQIGS